MVLELPYEGQDFYEIEICGLKRKLPVRKVSDGVWVASNHKLVLGSDVEFTQKVGEKLAEKLRESGKNPEVLLTAESKSLPLTYEVAKNLGHRGVAVARKSEKAYMANPVRINVKSITTSNQQKLVLDEQNQKSIKDKKVCLIDDVVSTGGTMKSLERLAEKVGAEVVCKAAVWLEGTDYQGDLIHLGELPVFTKQ